MYTAFRRTGLATLPALFFALSTDAAVPTIGQPAPALVAPAFVDGEVDLTAWRGQVVVLNLWASWCPPCRAELPMLARFAARHQADGMRLLALSADRHRDRSDARKAIGDLPLQAAFMDGATKNGYAAPEALPYTYVIDRAGIIRAVFPPGRGALDEASLESAVAPLLAQTVP